MPGQTSENLGVPSIHVFKTILSDNFSAGDYINREVRVDLPYRQGTNLTGIATVAITSFSDTVGGTFNLTARVNGITFETAGDIMVGVISYTILVREAGVNIDELVFTGFVTVR